MSTTTEERTTCRVGGCEEPVVTNLWDDEDRYCEAHQRVVDADEVYGEWMRAHDTMRERLGDVLDDVEDESPLTEPARRMMADIKRECARWMANFEAARWMAEHEEFQVGDRRITPEEAERAHRTLTRADRLGEAIEVVYRLLSSRRGSGGPYSPHSTRHMMRRARSWRALEGRSQPRAAPRSDRAGVPFGVTRPFARWPKPFVVRMRRNALGSGSESRRKSVEASKESIGHGVHFCAVGRSGGFPCTRS